MRTEIIPLNQGATVGMNESCQSAAPPIEEGVTPGTDEMRVLTTPGAEVEGRN